MTVTILCPAALADPDARAAGAPGTGFPAPALAAIAETQLQRAHLQRCEAAAAAHDEWPHDTWLRQQFGLPEGVHPEAGDALGLLPGAPPEGALVVRPVHLHVGLDQLTLLPPQAINLAAGAADALCTAANEHFGIDGPRLEVLAPGCWLLVPPRPLALQTWAASMAVGRGIRDYLPQGDDARMLTNWVNELQMLWHAHPVNEERENDGHLTVNWLWVEGPVPQPQPTGFASAHSDYPSVRALAQAAGIAQVATAPPAGTELAELFDGQPRLVGLAIWRRPVLEGDAAGWRDAWSTFADLIAPALRKAPGSARLELVLTGEHSLVALDWRARNRWKRWRKLERRLGELAVG